MRRCQAVGERIANKKKYIKNIEKLKKKRRIAKGGVFSTLLCVRQKVCNKTENKRLQQKQQNAAITKTKANDFVGKQITEGAYKNHKKRVQTLKATL